jgi:hypothetical protein
MAPVPTEILIIALPASLVILFRFLRGKSQDFEYSEPDLLQIAKYQKRILWLILIILILIPFMLRPGVEAAFALSIFGVYFLVRLSRALKTSTPLLVVFGILMLIPYVSFILLGLEDGRATRVLRKNGIKVGLMGAKKDDIKRIRGSLESKSQDIEDKDSATASVSHR